jgi:hypothetical protein
MEDTKTEHLPASGSWLHTHIPSEHAYPCEDDGACFCVHCTEDWCECEDCTC